MLHPGSLQVQELGARQTAMTPCSCRSAAFRTTLQHRAVSAQADSRKHALRAAKLRPGHRWPRLSGPPRSAVCQASAVQEAAAASAVAEGRAPPAETSTSVIDEAPGAGPGASEGQVTAQGNGTPAGHGVGWVFEVALQGTDLGSVAAFGGGYTRRGPRQERELIPAEDLPISVGDTVLGRVVWSSDRGAKIALAADSRVRGFCPSSHTPLQLRDTFARVMDPEMSLHMVREYVVLQIPDTVEVSGRGPLISAKQQDMEIFWRRSQQIAQLCNEDREVVNVKISHANRGGLIAVLQSMIVFIPYSKIPKETRMSQEELSAAWAGKEVDVVIEGVERENSKVVGSISSAHNVKLMRRVQVGSVVWARVTTVQPFGVFLNIENSKVNGLLHVSNISRMHVDTPELVFSVGEEVRVLIIEVQAKSNRISLSTAELEENDGDILSDKEAVYRNADAQAEHFRAHIRQLMEVGDYDGGEVLPRRVREARQSRQQERGSSRGGPPGQGGGFSNDYDDYNDVW